MKKPAILFTFFLSFLCGYSQRVQTIVPGQVVAGSAFQVQYIINDPSAFIDIDAPEFSNLQLISGPNYYKGNSLVNGKTHAIENITYTFVPLKTGIVKVNAVTARFKNNEEEKSDEITIAVLPQPHASFNALSTYTDINLYTPSSKTNLDKLIEANLFIKTEVDKRICFLGEAITATFKLYSRLQSTSEVINAPSLYGFSVMDILNTNEAHQAVETINGKIFNTSVLRKLQLYPAQTGKLTIDEMQLQNTIEFNDSITGKKVKVEKLLASNPVEIEVRSLPLKEPADYTGAVGQFTISADLPNSKITTNTQGNLLITITGKGNFIQFGQPIINWPKEFDVFDPGVSDELDKNKVPTEGRRKYSFSFATNCAGDYIIPPVSFSFFDPSKGQYKKLNTDSIRFEVTASGSDGNNIVEKQNLQPTKKPWLFFTVISALLIAVVAIFFWKRKRTENSQSLTGKTNYVQRLIDISSRQLTDKQFCFEIQKLLSDINKEYHLPHEQKQEIQTIHNDCQLLIYSDVSSEGKKEELQKKVRDFLKELES